MGQIARGRKRRLNIDDDIMAHCVNCDVVLTTETGVLASPDWYGSTRFVHYCKECQKAQFEDYVDQFGADMAFVMSCAAYNLPFIPEAVPSRREADGESWEAYLEQLKLLDQDVTDSGEPAAFSDGMTDLAVIFDGKVPTCPRFAGGLTSGGVAEKLEGTRRQRKNWGLSFKTAEYKELDRLFEIRSSRFKDGGMDEMMEFNLRELCKLQLAFSQAILLPSKDTWQDIVYGDEKFVVITYSSLKAIYSPDAINWVETTLPAGSTWGRVAYGSGVFVAISYSGNDKIAYSSASGPGA